MDKKNLIFVGSFVLALALIVFVFAATTVSSPAKFGNYSGTINFTITTGINVSGTGLPFNVTIYYNESGGGVDDTSTNLTTIYNSSDWVENFNASVSITGLTDGKYYNFTAYADNGTDQEWSVGISNVTIDNTGPAVTDFVSTVNGGIYSGAIVLNVSVVDATMSAGTVYFNITNSSGQQHNYTQAYSPGNGRYNISINTVGFVDGKYNVTVYSNDTLGNTNNTEYIQINLDNGGAPAVTSFANTVNGGNYSRVIVLNVSVVDAGVGVGTVYFNITNSSGQQHNYLQAYSPGSNRYNISVNTTGFVDGNYTVTVYSNDTAGTTNNTEYIQILIDNTAPTATPTCTPSPVNVGNSIDCTCGETDGGGSRIVVANTVSSIPDTEGTGDNKLFSCTFVDYAGNPGSAQTTYSVVQGGGGSTGGGGGSTSPQTWIRTLKVPDESFTSDSGYTKSLAQKERLQISIGGENHFVGVKSLTSTTAVIEVSSSPQQATFSIGDIKKFDVLDDGFYDIMVTLNDIASNRAEITTTSIHEAVPQPPAAEPVAESPEEAPVAQGETSTESGTSFAWGWLVLIVIFVIVGIVVFNKKKVGIIVKKIKKK